jgi:hypothetical protein
MPTGRDPAGDKNPLADLQATEIKMIGEAIKGGPDQSLRLPSTGDLGRHGQLGRIASK